MLIQPPLLFSCSPGHNVIVGRNGSGKSNFFSAIRFVLSDDYTSMSREERQALLHDSSSSTSTTLSAFVEIVFDNSDGRFPGSGAEVVLRRTIGLKKDEYSLDRRSASKADVSSLLEAAGFSRSNPYYIVPQGRITHLTNIKDVERLNLLKEVAGTRVYEQRRQESLKIMGETDSRRIKIEDTLKYIDERLAELDEEKEELKLYYEKDKDRRCLEYAIYQREVEELSFKLDDLEAHRKDEAEVSGSRQKEFRDREKELARLEQQVAETKQLRNQKQLEKETLIEERRGLARQLAQLDAQVKDDEESGERLQDKRAAIEERLAEIEVDMDDKDTELAALLPKWETTSDELDEAKERLEEIRARVAMLRSKGGRSAQFRDQAERDAALQAQVAELRAFEASQGQRLNELRVTRQQSEAKVAEVQQAIAAREEQLKQRKQQKDEAARAWQEKSERRQDLIEQKKEAWKSETKLTSSTAYAAEQLNNAQRALASTMDKVTSQGLQAVERIAKQHSIPGIHGPLYSLFDVDAKWSTAAEVTANTSLFHIVVDTDETASKVLAIMNKDYLGRVTFMPLNRLKPQQVEFPPDREAVPLISKLRFDKKYTAAMRQVFGQMLVCENLSVASAYMRSHGINTITLEGDKVEKRGALTGGYHDPRRSRLDSIRDFKRWKEMLDVETAELTASRNKINEMEQEVTALTSELQVLEAKMKQATNSRGPLLEELQWLRAEERDVGEQLSNLQAQEAALEREMKGAVAQRQALETEMSTPMRQGLTAEEQDELKQLIAQDEALARDVSTLSAQFSRLSKQKNDLSVEINELLRRERDDLSAQLEDLGEGDATSAARDSTVTDSRRAELAKLRKQLDDIKGSISSAEADLDRLAKKSQETSELYDKTYAEQTETARAIERQQKSIDRYMSRRQRYLEKKEIANGHIRDLGVLPEEAFEKYRNTALDRVIKRLRKVNEALKEFSGVNKKAVEQYNNFTKQRDQLTQRHGELEKSAESIQELIDVLDKRKDEDIERTFKQVSKNFEEVFAKLVPAGRGRLIMQKRVDQRDAADGSSDDDDDDDEQDRAGKSAIDNYTGVAIKVSFNSKVDEGLRIQQLSGGQKSLVALATVFAIQKCDPAPFYLFDEIDANLDAQYRTAVAAMIHELASGDEEEEEEEQDNENERAPRHKAQFITTTFRPEMVQVAEKHYGVLFDARKISNIRTISLDEAASFVDAAADPGGR